MSLTVSGMVEVLCEVLCLFWFCFVCVFLAYHCILMIMLPVLVKRLKDSSYNILTVFFLVA